MQCIIQYLDVKSWVLWVCTWVSEPALKSQLQMPLECCRSSAMYALSRPHMMYRVLSTVNSDYSSNWLWYKHQNQETQHAQTDSDRLRCNITATTGILPVCKWWNTSWSTNLSLETFHNHGHHTNDRRCHRHAHILQQANHNPMQSTQSVNSILQSTTTATFVCCLTTYLSRVTVGRLRHVPLA